jgi:hypothetical protein
MKVFLNTHNEVDVMGMKVESTIPEFFLAMNDRSCSCGGHG